VVYKLRYIEPGERALRYVTRIQCEKCAYKPLTFDDVKTGRKVAQMERDLARGIPFDIAWQGLTARKRVKAPCPTCKRVVVVDKGAREAAGKRRRYFCSEACEVKFYNARRSKRAARARSGKVCEMCGTGFEASRADAKFCSPRCRQRARRARTLA
jgi:hypothetical protein